MVNHSQLNVIFSALADHIRRAMVQRLAHGDATISELAQSYDKSLPAFLKHVQVLENAGLVFRTKQGRTNTLHLRPEPLLLAQDWLAENRAMWEAQFDNLAQFLEANAAQGEFSHSSDSLKEPTDDESLA